MPKPWKLFSSKHRKRNFHFQVNSSSIEQKTLRAFFFLLYKQWLYMKFAIKGHKTCMV